VITSRNTSTALGYPERLYLHKFCNQADLEQ